MSKETLEEAAEKYIAKDNNNRYYNDFIAGAKWQQERMYSEDDMINLLNFVSKEYNISNGIGWFHTHDSTEDVSSKEVLEQFKKK